MNKKVMIFTGAGISAPLKLPVTTGFNTTIDNIGGEVLRHIRTFLGQNSNDIEKVMYLLEDFVKEKDFTLHVLAQENHSPQASLIRGRKSEAKQALDNIKADIFSLLSKFEATTAASMYFNLIKEIREEFGNNTAFSFFTTNYDLSFENGFAEDDRHMEGVGIDRVLYGFKATKNLKFYYDQYEDFEWDPKLIEYRKLHGSLDWKRDEKGLCIRTGAALNPKVPASSPLLYPGFKGVPTEQPFVAIHEHLLKRLKEAHVVFVIGFAFRDEFITSIFEDAMKSNKKLTVIFVNPSPLDKFPDDSKVSHLCDKFKHCFFRLETGIEVKDNPLNLRSHISKTDVGERLKAFTFVDFN